jgi:hypothetical protein
LPDKQKHAYAELTDLLRTDQLRHSTFRNEEEMNATIGTVGDNSFIVQVRKETEEYEKFVKKVLKRK